MSRNLTSREELEKKLRESLDEAEWAWIQNHATRGAVVIADHPLNLIEVGVEIAEDNTQAIENWIQTGKLSKPSTVQLETWNLDPSRKFRCLVLQPYVLIQEIVQ